MHNYNRKNYSILSTIGAIHRFHKLVPNFQTLLVVLVFACLIQRSFSYISKVDADANSDGDRNVKSTIIDDDDFKKSKNLFSKLSSDNDFSDNSKTKIQRFANKIIPKFVSKHQLLRFVNFGIFAYIGYSISTERALEYKGFVLKICSSAIEMVKKVLGLGGRVGEAGSVLLYPNKTNRTTMTSAPELKTLIRIIPFFVVLLLTLVVVGHYLFVARTKVTTLAESANYSATIRTTKNHRNYKKSKKKSRKHRHLHQHDRNPTEPSAVNSKPNNNSLIGLA